MKKIFFIVFAMFFQLGADSVQPIQPIPSDPTYVPWYLTPASIEEWSKEPTSIRHGKDPNPFYGAIHNLCDKEIFFGRDISGKPIRKKISEHATDNPQFGKVLLVLYYPHKKYKKQFVILGTYSDSVARKKFLRKMQTLFGYAHNCAIWYPEQNVIIVCKKNNFTFEGVRKKFEQWLRLKSNYK